MQEELDFVFDRRPRPPPGAGGSMEATIASLSGGRGRAYGHNDGVELIVKMTPTPHVHVAEITKNGAVWTATLDETYPDDIQVIKATLLADRAMSALWRRARGPGGVDVVYDAASGAYSEAAVRCLGWEGLFLVVGFPVGVPKVPLTLALLKSCQIRGAVWGAFTTRDPQIHQGYLAEL